MIAIKKSPRRYVPATKMTLLMIATGACALVVGWNVSLLTSIRNRIVVPIQQYRAKSHVTPAVQNTNTFIPPTPSTTEPTSGPVAIVKRVIEDPAQPESSEPWGVAKKVDDVTYSIKVGYDPAMATPDEVFQALNAYRATKGSQALAWSPTLASYAQGRAVYFDSIKGTDKHAGFNSFLNDQGGFAQLHFNRLGENSFYGGPLSGTHVIEWVFSQSPGHNSNQLDTGWTHVGIGTSQTAINVNFGSEEF